MADLIKLISGGKTWLWVTYTEGTEDSISLTFQTSRDGNTYFDLLEPDNATAVALSLVGTQTKTYVMTTPQAAQYMKIGYTYVNPVKSGTLTFAGDGTTLTFSGTLDTVVQGTTISVAYTIGGVAYTGTDDGSGTITGTDLSGTIDYNTGALSLTFTTAPDASTTITVSYSYKNEGTFDIKITGDYGA